MKTTDYFETVAQITHPEVQREWYERVLTSPLKVLRQPNGRFSYWAVIPEYGSRVLRVITLEDGETVHNAFFDRNFFIRLRRGLEP